MSAADWSSREGHRMLQLCVLLFLFGLLAGFAVPAFAVPRLGLTTHVLGVTQGIVLITMAQAQADAHDLWDRILAGHLQFVSWAVTLLAAVWGAGVSMMPIAAGHLGYSTLAMAQDRDGKTVRLLTDERFRRLEKRMEAVEEAQHGTNARLDQAIDVLTRLMRVVAA